MRRALRYVVLVLALAVLAGAAYRTLRGGAVTIEEWTPMGRPPRIRPDYTSTVVPPNIAPLNFCVDEDGDRYCVKVRSSSGDPIEVVGTTGQIVIPPGRWRKLLDANRGEELHFDVYVQAPDGRWSRFDTITNSIAAEEIDRYMVYRRINVMYDEYVRMGIHQYDLENAEDILVLDNRSFDGGCMNCHTFWNNSTEKMLLHVRSGQKDYGMGMLLVQDGVVEKVDARTEFSPRPAAFSSWHPSGRVVAFSTNKVRQFFHHARTEIRDGTDLDSDMGIYLLDSKTVASTAAICRPDRLETWPAWSADGAHLYFCSSPVPWSDRDTVPPEHYEQVRYDLVRIGYDVNTGTWGEAETVLSSEDTGLSITLPRASPDGRFLVFCMSEYSTFPTFQPSSDLYLMDLAGREYRRMECNSDRAESWHSWSSNSRWLAFSSKRGDGLFIRAYFSYVDENGTAHKPFVLPQSDPVFYDSFIKLYQMPEMVRELVPVRGEEIAGVIRSAPWTRSGPPVTAPTPRAASEPVPPSAEGPEAWTPHVQ
ncbi:MAG: PD40 domain-containing protein [Candidatus Brocadiae bacterium]|nr:PD40 domain-containing protein [Candidatus Brocadiia bacterium]